MQISTQTTGLRITETIGNTVIRLQWLLALPGKGIPIIINYHKKSDTIETLDFEVMAEAVNALVQATFKFEN